jgi:uncharacterized protein YecT (DUF1311 family)
VTEGVLAPSSSRSSNAPAFLIWRICAVVYGFRRFLRESTRTKLFKTFRWLVYNDSMKIRILLAVSCALTFIHPHPASAMDCNNATTNYEQIVCTGPKLLAADKTLNEAFAKAMASRSASDKVALRRDQKDWLDKIAEQIDDEFKSGEESISAYLLQDKLTSRAAALLEKRNGIAQEIALKIKAIAKPGTPVPAFQEIKGLGLLPMVANPLTDSEAKQDWSKLLANPIDAVNFKNVAYSSVYEFKSTTTGKVVFDFMQSAGTMQCDTHLYLVSNESRDKKLRVVDPGLEELCGAGEEGSNGYTGLYLYNGNPILVTKKEDRSNTVFKFLDVFGADRTSSILTIEAHNAFEKSDRAASCKEENDCFSLEQIKGLFRDFSAIDTAPLITDANGKKLEGLVTDQAVKAKLAALPALKVAWQKTFCAENCVGSKPQFPEPVVVDLDGKGQLAVVISATENEPFTQTLLFAGDSTGQWTDVNSVKVQDLSKDFKGYDFAGAVLDGERDQPFANGAQIQLRINDIGSLRILRFGEFDLGWSHRDCCALHELRLDGNKIEVVQKLGLTPRAILDSVTVSAVGVPRESGN